MQMFDNTHSKYGMYSLSSKTYLSTAVYKLVMEIIFIITSILPPIKQLSSKTELYLLWIRVVFALVCISQKYVIEQSTAKIYFIHKVLKLLLQ